MDVKYLSRTSKSIFTVPNRTLPLSASVADIVSRIGYMNIYRDGWYASYLILH